MKNLCCLFSVLLLTITLQAQNDNTIQITVQTNKVSTTIQPTMYGLFFEDINFGADGGLYAELIKNRSFEFPQSLMSWKTFGNVQVCTENAPFERNPHYVRLSKPEHAHKQTGLENEGFRGIGIKAGEAYRFSVWGRSANGTEEKLRIELVDAKDNVFEKQEITLSSRQWKEHEIVMYPKKVEEKALLRIYLISKGDVELDHISLFPVDTWKGRKNGLRKDLAQALFDLNPGVFRFPGGCIVEGTELETRYNWKHSVGPVENRPLNENRWNFCFPHRLFPDYYQSYGMGYYELFLLSEDMGAEPLPILSCGLACQFQNEDMCAHAPVDGLEEYVNDALDLIEFANGSIDSQWGKVRAEMGHPESFNLKFIGIGNEQWGPEYPERLEVFVKAIRKKYPGIKIVGSVGPSSDGDKFDYLWPEMRRLKVDLVDEHYYKSPEWFFSEASRYDNFPRTGPKVFAGEYACHTSKTENNFESALAEAAFLTGLERNADVVHMATYAPLFAHVDGWQWKPDMIWFDNLNCVLTPNYYVQQMYGQNPGTNIIPLTLGNKPLTGESGLYGSAVWDKDKKQYIIKLVNSSTEKHNLKVTFAGLKKNTSLIEGECTLLHAPDLSVQNTIDNPYAIKPRSTSAAMDGNRLCMQLAPGTFAVYTFNIQ